MNLAAYRTLSALNSASEHCGGCPRGNLALARIETTGGSEEDLSGSYCILVMDLVAG
jgi:hypothetical protein